MDEVFSRAPCRWLRKGRLKVEEALELLHEERGLYEALVAEADTDALAELELARIALGGLDRSSFLAARAACNPCEGLKNGGFVCRSALKLANLDAMTNWSLCSRLVRYVDVCSAPGGFTEYIWWRSEGKASGWAISLRGSNDDGEGVALKGSKRAISVWGPTGNGDIYVHANADSLIEAARPVQLCVADGGFEANRDAKDQDLRLERLALCEAAVAWASLAVGGSFVLKLFLPLKSRGTLAILALAAADFDQFALVKPLASRAASGEIYLVAIGFRNRDPRRVIEALRHRANRLSSRNLPQQPPIPSAPSPDLIRVADFVASLRTKFVSLQTSACRRIVRYAAGERHLACSCNVQYIFRAWRVPFQSAGHNWPGDGTSSSAHRRTRRRRAVRDDDGCHDRFQRRRLT